ncbi:MAG: SDR family oxidoreductase [Edaphobacter sp.]
MKILIAGNLGYVGSVLVRHLRYVFPDAVIEGVDTGYFSHCLTAAERIPEISLDAQHFCDLREIPEKLLDGVDSVIQLAAISNDPMGKRFERPTEEINFKATVRLAHLASKAGVRSYTFASSCSVYGTASATPRTEEDEVNPLTAYALSKINSETALREADLKQMVVTCLRFATACGMSDRLRLDLVLNDFVAGAIATGKISVLSDGTPWRPLIDVKDMARAIEWALQRRADNRGTFLTVNTGSQSWNYQVRDLAQAVAAALPGTKISINENAAPDKRSYQVDFSLYKSLAPQHLPKQTLEISIAELRDGLKAMNFGDENFRVSNYMRLRVLESHLTSGRLTDELRWAK